MRILLHRHHNRPPYGVGNSHHVKGFALIATISVMVLLVMIALAMLSLSTIEVRQTRLSDAQAVARANARLALMIAIGELQKHAGPDQRVTAAAEIRGATTNRKWTGVWSTTTIGNSHEPMVGGHENEDFFTDKRSSDASLANNQWKNTLHLSWLVSGDAASPQFSGESVELVGDGAIGASVADEDRVSVPLVRVQQPGSGARGAYAYWVSDESQKARIDLAPPAEADPNKNSPSGGGYYRLAGAEGPGFSKVKSGPNEPYQPVDGMLNKDRAKVITPNTLGVALNNQSLNASIKTNFHDVTAKSYSVMADVRAGGLMKDMTDYLRASGDIAGVSGVPGTGMASDRPIMPGDKYRELGPNFLHFKNWYKLSEEISGSQLGGGSIEPQFIPSRADADGNYTEGQTSDISKKAQPVQPVMTDCRMAFDFSRDSSRGGGRAIRIHLYPRVTLWNPYNITLKGARYIVACPIPRIANLRVDGKVLVNAPGANSGSMWGALSGSLVYFVTKPIDMAPGECLVFSPDSAASSSTKIGGNSNLYNFTSVGSNVLSASIPTGQNNFYIESGKAADPSVNITAASPIRYGIPSGVNNAFTSRALYFMLKRAPNTGTLNASSALNSPSISTILMEPAGKRRYGWWFVYRENTHPVNNATLPGFTTYSSSPNRNPPRLWFIQGRMRWMDEYDELQSLGQQWGRGAGILYHNPVIGNFNVRSPYIHRSPYCYYHDWPRYAPGPSMLPWATPRLGDGRNQLPYRDSKSYGSPFGLPSEWGAIKSYAMFDLPNKDMPVFSLASLQHAQVGFQGWQPTYVVGHSNAEPRSDRDASLSRTYYQRAEAGTAWGKTLSKNGSSGTWSSIVYQQLNDILCYDITYSTNQMLWDKYFLSTIPDYTSGWDALTDSLPNSRLVLNKPASVSSSEVSSYLGGGKSFDYAAYFLMNKGAFNVNSTSVEAWRALFSSLSRVPRPDAGGGESQNAFSRLLVPRTSQSTGSQANASETKHAASWEGVRALSDAEVERLAIEMVKIVKERGPFLSMSDFVNRRLAQRKNTSPATAFDDESFCGPLQAAIEKAELNQSLQIKGQNGVPVDEIRTDMGGANTGGGLRPDANSYFPFKTYGAPGYLTQADVLQTVAPGLTARGDTFVIRAYGEARDKNDRIIAKAWCEATVQRTQDYLISNSPDSASNSKGNNPLEPVTISSENSLTLSPNNQLLPLNAKYGRQFKLVDFRWLSDSEI